MTLKIENISINKLMPYENNARKHTEEDVQTIINSIQEFGFNDPVGVWGENNIIVEGHGRFLAAKKLGIKEIPCIRLDELSDEQRKAYSLAHNKTAEMSTWDFDLLQTEPTYQYQKYRQVRFSEGHHQKAFQALPDYVLKYMLSALRLINGQGVCNRLL